MLRLAAAVAAHSARPDACAIPALALAALDHACLAEERPLPYRKVSFWSYVSIVCPEPVLANLLS
jgi:hypothetical protein